MTELSKDETTVGLDQPALRVAGTRYCCDARQVDWKGQDLYTIIAACMHDISPPQVTRDQRFAAKQRFMQSMRLATWGESEPLPLTFSELQDANRERGKVWGKGQNIPSLFNAVELGGEVGELIEAMLMASAHVGKVMNAVKKHYRDEIGIAGGVSDLQPIIDELGDVVICCSLLANKLGIDLGRAVAEKFNKTSKKHGFPHRLAA